MKGLIRCRATVGGAQGDRCICVCVWMTASRQLTAMRSYWDPRLLGSRAGPGLGEAAEEPDNEINLATGGSEDPAARYDAAGGGDGRGYALKVSVV